MTTNSPNYKMEISVGDQTRVINFENFKFDKSKLNSYDGLLLYLIYSYNELEKSHYNLWKNVVYEKYDKDKGISTEESIDYELAMAAKDLKSCFFMIMKFLNASEYDKAWDVEQNKNDEIFFNSSFTNLIMNKFVVVKDGDVNLSKLSNNDEMQIKRMVGIICDAIEMINAVDYYPFNKDKTALTKIY